MLVQRFEPQGRRFTNFPYYYIQMCDMKTWISLLTRPSTLLQKEKNWRSFAGLVLGKMRERNLSWGSGKSDSQLEVQTKGGHHNIGDNGSSVGLQL